MPNYVIHHIVRYMLRYCDKLYCRIYNNPELRQSKQCIGLLGLRINDNYMH